MDTEELTALLDALPANDDDHDDRSSTTTVALPPPAPPRLPRAFPGVDPHPADGDAAREASLSIVSSLTSSPGRVPAFVDAEWSRAASSVSSRASPDPVLFVDLSTGLRVGVHAWGPESAPLRVLLLHDLGESGASLASIARPLAARGHRVVAPDARGHGDSQWSASSAYSPSALAADAVALILELHLYVRPILLVGFGMGATAALVLAARHPSLVAALALVEASPDAPADAWTYHPLQAGVFRDERAAAECMRAPEIEEGRVSPEAVLAKARTCLRPSRDAPGAVRMKMDPRWRFDYTRDVWVRLETSRDATHPPRHRASVPVAPISHSPPISLPDPSPLTLVASTRCPLRVVRGASSRFSTASGVAALISLARRVATISAHAVDVPGAGHRPMEERPRAFRDAVLDLARAAEREATGVDARARTPESVGIADPPAFATVEEAARALAPRAIPTAEAVEAALAEAREGDEAPSEDEAAAEATRRTALIRDDPDYFGFCG